MTSSLVGSEMCIRDRSGDVWECSGHVWDCSGSVVRACLGVTGNGQGTVSYTHLTLPTICSV
eukprot:398621-Prorocentrum_lima.AAC.1